MEAKEIGSKLVQYCKEGKEKQALDELYHADAVSVEATNDDKSIAQGLEAIKGKHEWWDQATIVHSTNVEGPFPNRAGDQFSVIFEMDVTMKEDNQRFQMKEVGLYSIKDGKISKEEFHYMT